ncbi:sodium:proline symporter [Haladaptatus sp. DJG-WS-42]|uniref:sodium:solute symporter family transporter n=1 Tax=Haladaptatus sp. DJG-WS-42 TaxID=3120516 RepID=UPI0030D1CC3F
MVTASVALGLTVLTLVTFAGLGTWYARGRINSVEDYITARNSTGNGMTTATLIASGMGAWILFSPAEAGAAFGGLTAVLGYAIGSALPLFAFIVIGPRIRELIPEGHSITEYTLARFGPVMYVYVLLVSITYMFIFLAAEMTGIAGALSLVAGVPTWQTAALVGLFVLAYTGYGGLKASIFTDTVQTLVILPILAIGFAGALLALGGTGEIYQTVAETSPSLLDPGFLPGIEFGAYIAVAVLAAEMLNQAWWQRIYAAKDERTLARSFTIAAITVIPMVFLAGLFGLAASGLGLVTTDFTAGYNADISFFLVLDAAFPEWVTLVVVILAILLVMSTADTLFNAIASIVTADLPLVMDDPDRSTLTNAARALTVVVALAAIFVGAQGYSVLTIFLIADLLAAATFIPLLFGLYSTEATGFGALVSSILGLLVGLAYFPTLRAPLAALPVIGDLLPTASYFNSFVGAAVVSGLAILLISRVTPGSFDLGSLSRTIHQLDEVRPDGGEER